MRLSSESGRVRWGALGATWVVVAILLCLHAVGTRDFLDGESERGLRGRLSPDSPFQMAYLPGAVDAQEWVQHANALLNDHTPQLRHTDIDNAPFGREVHWNSAWAWIIAGSGWIYHRVTGDPIGPSLERATIWLNPAVLLLLIVLISSYAARRAGAIAGVVVAMAMLGHNNFYDGFEPNYVDHHGLLTAAIFGMVLAAMFMGAGWRQEPGGPTPLLPDSQRDAHRAAVVSAVSGALGLWVSAASVIPPIAFVGLSGLATVLVCGRTAQRNGLRFDPSVWRTWGRVGAAVSVFFYLVEYFPTHLGFRLEVNHPFYALAWLGGGELIAEIGERWLAPTGSPWRQPHRLFGPLALVLIAPVTIMIGRAHVFAMLDPFLAAFYSSGFIEFTPVWQLADAFSWNPYISVVGIESLALLAGVGVLIARRRQAAPLLWFATLATIAFTIQAWMQMRWLTSASGPQIALALVLVATFTANRATTTRWVASVGVFGAMFMPTAIGRVVQRFDDVTTKRVTAKHDMFVVYRDVAEVLRGSQMSGDIRLLANPNESLIVGYYGQFKTLGTGFWENIPGLKASAEIFTAPTPDSAAALIRARKVTHIMLVEGDDFVEEYYQLLHPGAPPQDAQNTFGYLLLYANAVPAWLQAIPYSLPDDLRSLDARVHLFRVNFDQKPYDALYEAALAEMARGDTLTAGHDFDLLIQRNPLAYLPLLGKGQLLLSLQRWDSAARVTLGGIRLAPPADHPRLYQWLASSFMQARQPAHEMQVYRASLAEKFDPEVACVLASALSTARDDKLRDGAEAFGLARRALATQPTSPAFLNCLAMALAETGRFAEAVAASEKAKSAAQAAGDTGIAEMSEELLEAFRSGKPWRDQP